jgi:hypothetical protein
MEGARRGARRCARRAPLQLAIQDSKRGAVQAPSSGGTVMSRTRAGQVKPDPAPAPPG